MGENICTPYIGKGADSQDLQRTHTVQQKENK